jgi:urea carboxylase
MFSRILIANRGEIACRIQRTAHRMGIETVAVCSEADRFAPHVRAAAAHVVLGPAPPNLSYLNRKKVLTAARDNGAEAIHPGYGFLSEDPDFAESCQAAGIKFIGPDAASMRLFALKHRAREAAEEAGLPLAPGSKLLDTAQDAIREADRIGYPVILKGTAGGGGIGLQVCENRQDVTEAFALTARLSARSFNNAGVFLERYIARGRHIEVQIFGDGTGRVAGLGLRDCSAQRRHQKLIEETPPPNLPEDTARAIADAALRLGRAVRYANAGTVEFIYDTERDDFFFLEVNTRLQVEHCVTEAVSGIDLVEWMIREAAGDETLAPLLDAPPARRGVAIEARIYAEDPVHDFRPQTGIIADVAFPAIARIETWIAPASEVTPFYDPLLAKLIVHAATRADAVANLADCLAVSRIAGVETNLGYLRAISAAAAFHEGSITTQTLAAFSYAPRALIVLDGGTSACVQELPGRLGLWSVGVPPSLPFDSRAFRAANLLLGNQAESAAIEITIGGLCLRIAQNTRLCLAGAPMASMLDGAPVPWHAPFAAAAGSVLKLGGLLGHGCRAYLAVEGGIDTPPYLGSRATFTLGKFGGHAGRALIAGDVVPIGTLRGAPVEDIPAPYTYSCAWDITVTAGPHAAPDFFTEADIDAFYAATWEVHYNSNRTGIRLIGPKPQWARPDGGEAGLHPSNIHDNAYAIGAVDFTGDMPVILGPDGPSLGGFVCPCTVASEDLWKLGQLRPNDTIRFHLRADAQEAILLRTEANADRPMVTYRRSGDENLLIEFGENRLDIALRLRVHVLAEALREAAIGAVIDLTPGIRSLQIHFDNSRTTLSTILARAAHIEASLPPLRDVSVESRIVHLPLSWDDSSTREATTRYMQSVRADAPWCPSNIEFIRRINGLSSAEEVREIVFAAHYLVLGLGDVYLGAPVATPVDPRHRLVTTKYNPARTYTPENAVGIGGAYLCIYGMEGPGGYQFVGRTCQVWNSFARDGAGGGGTPWLLRFFDQIRFYPVSEDDLATIRAASAKGAWTPRVEQTRFSLRDHEHFLAEHAAAIAEAKARQQAAFEAERARWREAGIALAPPPDEPAHADTGALRPDETAVTSPVSGAVWRVAVLPGQHVRQGETILIVESMKIEIAVPAPSGGIIRAVLAAEGRMVRAGQRLAVLGQTDAA